MKRLLSAFNLGDAYEINARVLPAMLVVLPVAVLIAQLEWQRQNWLALIGWAGGLQIVLALFVSKVGQALGARLQGRLEKAWGGLPTEKWLLPSNQEHSEQLKAEWRRALSRLSGLNLESVAQSSASEEALRLLADSVAVSRNVIRKHPKASLVRAKNIEYGFARNLVGLRWLALGISLVCLGVSLYGALGLSWPAGGVVLQAIFVVIAGAYVGIARQYVKHCADRYAEFFFGAVLAIAEERVGKRPKRKTTGLVTRAPVDSRVSGTPEKGA
jgi:hypothetical protein